MAGWIAADLGWEVIAVPARWDIYQGGAGPRRNKQMCEMLDIAEDVVLAFHEDLGKSKGTKDCVGKALDCNLKTFLLPCHEALLENF